MRNVLRRLTATAVAVVAVTAPAACDNVAASKWKTGQDLPTVTPTWLPGIQVINDGSADRKCAWAISYPSIPGAEPLTSELRKNLERRVDGFLGNRDNSDRATCRATEDGPEFNASFAYLVASRDVVGIRTTTVDQSAAGAGIDNNTIWYDGKAGRVRPTADLLTWNDADAVTAAFRTALAGRDTAITDNLPEVLDDHANMNDAGFTTDGDLIVTFARGSLGPAAVGDIAVLISRDHVDPLLSDFGKRAQQQTMHPDHRLQPSQASASSPSGSPAPASFPPSASSEGPDCRKVTCVALTFDDGPGRDTRRLLEILAEHRAHATFFLVGQNVANNPQVVRDEVAAGHEIGNHTWSHRDLTTLTPAAITDQLHRTDRAIQEAVGFRPAIVRPPYGAFDQKVRDAVDRPLIIWAVDPRDWEHRDSAYVADYITQHVRPGDVVLMHDIHRTTVDAVPAILDTLAGKGYHFVTVSQLFSPKQLTTARTWSVNPKAHGR